MTIRVLIADDQELVRAGFRKLLDAEESITVVGEAADGAQAVTRATELAPDVVLMDIRLPRLDGIEATRRLITEFARRPPEGAPRALPDLTPRETEVLIQVARGLSNREIAGQLFLGEATIKTYVGNILLKLGCRDRVQAVVAAYEAGLVQPGHHG